MNITVRERIHSQDTSYDIPEEATITSKEEFYEIPFIKGWHLRDDFLDFYKYKSKAFSASFQKECWVLYCKISYEGDELYFGIGYLFGDASKLDIIERIL